MFCTCLCRNLIWTWTSVDFNARQYCNNFYTLPYGMSADGQVISSYLASGYTKLFHFSYDTYSHNFFPCIQVSVTHYMNLSYNFSAP